MERARGAQFSDDEGRAELSDDVGKETVGGDPAIGQRDKNRLVVGIVSGIVKINVNPLRKRLIKGAATRTKQNRGDCKRRREAGPKKPAGGKTKPFAKIADATGPPQELTRKEKGDLLEEELQAKSAARKAANVEKADRVARADGVRQLLVRTALGVGSSPRPLEDFNRECLRHVVAGAEVGDKYHNRDFAAACVHAAAAVLRSTIARTRRVFQRSLNRWAYQATSRSLVTLCRC